MWELETTGEDGGLGFTRQQGDVVDPRELLGAKLVGFDWQRKGVVQRPGKWYGISVGLHLAAMLLVAVWPATVTVPREPVVIDLTLDSSPIPAAVAETSRQQVVAARTVAPPRPAPVRFAPKPARETTLPEPAVQAAAPLAAPVQQVALPVTAPSETVARQSAASNGGAVATGGAPQAAAGQARGSSALPTAGTDSHPSPEKARSRYLREHFAYIRDLIMKKLAYPHMARKMGWSGKVNVSFVINDDGSANDIKVVESSGFPILDKCAMETVRAVAPFPRPPVRAEIIIPVVFKLM